ncbi:hypothetical protein PR202_gb26387 [Eleusine coracana subsp. coracana]|uniref:Alpha/beta hydrolase fold-3 domain-containing protein n=1 Tax=Eleusine coracana subsp. coracana TaxID=191504 RepID=A0AAV5FRQ3_ELECO|nr:hypothetical protein PR202_gb26387 [Eleusine coracana subsp. coracana]
MAMSSNAAPPHVVEDCLGVLQLLSDGTVLRSDFPVLPTESFPDVTGVQWKDVVYDSERNLKLRMYRRPDTDTAEKLPVLVYFHGGGFCLGSFAQPNIHACCLRLAAELPAVVLSADYRLAPEHRLPAAIDDGAAVLSWLRTAGGGVDPWLTESIDFSRVFVSGESAGANIAHHLAVRFGSDVRVAGCVLLTPFFGGAERTASESRPPPGVFLTIEMADQFWRMSLPEGADRDHPLANPVCSGGSSLEVAALPPVLVVAAGRDLLRDRVLGYAERLKVMGKVVEVADFVGEEHGFFVLQPWGEAAAELIRVMRRFIHNGASSS